VAGAKRVVIVMEHTTKDGHSKLLRSCSLPVTGRGVVKLVITDLGVFDVRPGRGITLRELRPGITLDEVRVKTECRFDVELSSS
jgi:3-oxoacid CoA-transferase